MQDDTKVEKKKWRKEHNGEAKLLGRRAEPSSCKKLLRGKESLVGAFLQAINMKVIPGASRQVQTRSTTAWVPAICSETQSYHTRFLVATPGAGFPSDLFRPPETRC
jgi:hypothetical protein